MPNLLQNPEASFLRIQARLETVALPESARLASFDIKKITAGLQQELDRLASRRAEATAAMSPEQQAAFDAALQEVTDLAGALVWLDVLHRRDIQEAASYDSLLERCREHQRIGFIHLDALAVFGAVASAEATRLRAGRGAADTIDDLVALAQLFERHWTTLEPMQPLHPNPALRLSPERIQTMKDDAASLRAASRAVTNAWRDPLMRAQHLLLTSWDRLRLTAAGGYAWANQLEWADAGHPSLFAIQRRTR